MTATVLSVAGSDPSGGAGIQADLKTFSALGAYGAAAITALTAQNTRGVTGVFPVPGTFVADQLEALFTDLDVRAVKTGMLGGPDVVEAVAASVAEHGITNLVVDPVMVAASGDRLVGDDTVAAIRDRLLPVATLVTPNLPEAAALLGWDSVTPETMAKAADGIRALGAGAALVKAGHADGPQAVDVLSDAEGIEHYRAPRVETRNTHGTGCTLSSAIAARLAQGAPLRDAVDVGKRYVTAALQAADTLRIGHGTGPVHHFHSWWEASP